MKDIIYLGPTPADESCAQSGDSDFSMENFKECLTFKLQLEKQFSQFKGIVRFKLKTEAHEFGAYKEVVVEYDDENQSSTQAAFDIEENASPNWTQESKTILADYSASTREEVFND